MYVFKLYYGQVGFALETEGCFDTICNNLPHLWSFEK